MNSFKHLTQFCVLVSLALSGCATTGQQKKLPISDAIKSIGTPSDGSAVLVVYRKTENFVSPLGVDLLIDGKKILNIGNSTHHVLQVPIGAREIRASIPSEVASCSRKITVRSGSVVFVKIRDNGDWSPALGMFSPLAAAIRDSSKQNETGCGGMVEPAAIDEATALREIDAL